MRARSFPILGIPLIPVLTLGSPAGDDEHDCSAGYEGCPCAQEYRCLDAFDCSTYAEATCAPDLTDDLDCLTKNSGCKKNDMIDVSGWGSCVSLVKDCA